MRRGAAPRRTESPTRYFVVLTYDLPKEQGVAWQYKPYPWVSAVAGTNYCYIGLAECGAANLRIGNVQIEELTKCETRGKTPRLLFFGY